MKLHEDDSHLVEAQEQREELLESALRDSDNQDLINELIQREIDKRLEV